MLLHLHSGLDLLAGFRQELVLFGSVHVNTERYTPILALLALSDDQDLSSLIIYEPHNQMCIQSLWELCRSIKQNVQAFILLLTDIAFEQANRACSPRTVAMILEQVRQAIELVNDESSPLLFTPLSLAVKALRTAMLTGLPVPGTTKDRKVMAREADRIYRHLQTKSAANMISAYSQLRLLSCARAHLSAVHPASGRLAAYISP
jgi:hypothetical protein